MKRYVVIIGLAMALAAHGQRVYKEQIRVSAERFTIQGELLRVQMRVSYNGDVLNSGEMLNFTPVLKDDGQRQALSSVVINGKERSRYERRQAALYKRQRLNIPVVKRDKRQGTYFFDYDTTIPFADWMRGAALYIESEESGWTGRSHLYEDKLIDHIAFAEGQPSADDAVLSAATPAPEQTRRPERPATTVGQPVAAPLHWIAFLPLSATAPVSEKTVSGVIALSGAKGLAGLKDKDFCEAIEREVKARLAAHGAEIASLSLHGYGAPTGNYRRNEQRSAERAQLLKEHLIASKIAGMLSVTWTAEDWPRIIQLAQSDNTLTLRSAALDVMQNVDITSGREDQLRMLASGQTYSQLAERVFPQVQRIEYTATLQHRMVNGSEPAELQSLYKTATALRRGSSEFNDLVDVAARLYPDNAVAAINAAGVALTKGDLDKAERYLAPWQTDARAYQNLGVLSMLRGDVTKAEVYLKMAEAQGVGEASVVLGKLNN